MKKLLLVELYTDEDDNEIVNTLDAEDFSVMLDLYFHKTGKLQVPKKSYTTIIS